jgi:hypothetical protein
MPTLQRLPQELAVVYLYDPVPLDKFALDPVRAQTPFSGVLTFPEAILLFSPEKRIKAQVQTGRLEYTDESERGFEARELSPLKQLWKVLPLLSVKAYGVNVHVRIRIEGCRAGAFVRDKFLCPVAGFETRLGKPIIGSATRIMYGQTDEFFDVRLTPLDVDTDWLYMQLHYHKAISITDTERVVAETDAALGSTLQELLRLEAIIWQDQ